MGIEIINISSNSSKPKRPHSFWLSYCCSVSESEEMAKKVSTTETVITTVMSIDMESKSANSVFSNSPYKNVVPTLFSLSDQFPNSGYKLGNSNLWNSLNVPLRIGSFLGLIPVQGLSQRKDAFRWLHYGTVISTFVTTALILHTFCITYNFLVKVFTEKISARDLILSISGVWFYSAGTFVYFFFLLRAKQLSKFFQLWKDTSIKISNCLMPDKHLERNVILITLMILLDCVGENILFHFHLMTGEQLNKLSSLTFSQFLQDYYYSNQYIFKFFDYSVVISLAMLITNKLATIAWNFGDLILILIARMLHERYWALNEYIRSQIDLRVATWANIRTTFLEITNLLYEANRQFSPLIWLSCTTDVFFICRQLYEGLSPRPFQTAWLNKVYLWWSLFHLIGRALGVNAMAIALNEEAHRTFKIIQQCHPSEYNEEVRRLEIFLGGTILGISGSGCFVITRSFLTMIISAIFTLEVVLLQNANVTVG